MLQAIEKLQQEKEKLTSEFVENRNEYKSEIKRINKAIRKFSQGYEALGNVSLENSPKRGMASEIEKILENRAVHIKEIVAELSNRGFSPKYQSVSAVLQVYAKAGKKFIKVLPATYALIPTAVQIEEVQADQNIDLDETLSNEFLSDETYEF